MCVCVRVCVLRHMCMRACVCTYTCGPCVFVCYVIIIIIIIIYPLTARVVGAPQMISQPVSSICPCSPLPSGSWRTPGQSIPCCRLPTAFSICLVFFPLSQCLARWFVPDLMNGSYAVSVESDSEVMLSPLNQIVNHTVSVESEKSRSLR